VQSAEWVFAHFTKPTDVLTACCYSLTLLHDVWQGELSDLLCLQGYHVARLAADLHDFFKALDLNVRISLLICCPF
jgi:hypothetical protein